MSSDRKEEPSKPFEETQGPGRPKRWWDYTKLFAGVLASLASLLSALFANFAASRTASLTTSFKNLAPDLQVLVIAVPAAAAGLMTLFYSSFSWYRRQLKLKRLAAEDLQKKEGELLSQLGESLVRLLEEKV